MIIYYNCGDAKMNTRHKSEVDHEVYPEQDHERDCSSSAVSLGRTDGPMWRAPIAQFTRDPGLLRADPWNPYELAANTCTE